MLIGAAIYLLYGAFAEPVAEADDKTIIVSAGVYVVRPYGTV